VQARTRQLLAKLLLESTPLTVERDNKKRNISVRCFTFLVAPLMVERERERARGASPPLMVASMCIPA
jgi:hypothetical protein